MGEIVYVDLLFLINFSMDFLCFYLLSRILSQRMSLPRVLIASAIGGIYSDIVLFADVDTVLGIFIDVSICVVMNAIAFLEKRGLKRLPIYVGLYFAVSMALGGVMTAVFNLLNRVDIPIEESTQSGISILNFALLAGVSALITLIGGRIFKKKITEKTAELCICIRGKTKVLKGLSDSGNLLYDPIGRTPCIVCDLESVKDILPKGIYYAASSKGPLGVHLADSFECKGVRILPVTTASGEGMLIAIRPDEIKIVTSSGQRSIDAYIALGEVRDISCGCKALIPTELMI